MRLPSHQSRNASSGFTLLEMVVVLAIIALVLSAVYTIAKGTLVLADDVRRTQQRESRQQAFITFCERLFAELPASATLNLKTTEEGGQYLTRIDLDQVPSFFDGGSDCEAALFTETVAGGGLRLVASCRKKTMSARETRVVLFAELVRCEWRAFDPATQQWTTVWNQTSRPRLFELSLASPGEQMRSTFWIAPDEAVAQ